MVPSAQKLVPSENCLNFVSNSKYTKIQGGNRKGNLKIIVPALYIKIGSLLGIMLEDQKRKPRFSIIWQ